MAFKNNGIIIIKTKSALAIIWPLMIAHLYFFINSIKYFLFLKINLRLSFFTSDVSIFRYYVCKYHEVVIYNFQIHLHILSVPKILVTLLRYIKIDDPLPVENRYSSILDRGNIGTL